MTYAEKKAQARQKAIDWQHEFSERVLSYGEIIAQAEKFRRLGKKYGLIREFRENAII